MQNQKPQLDFSKTKEVRCKCGNDIFVEAFKVRTVSPIITGLPEEMVIPITILVCKSCGAINEETLPKELKSMIVRP